MPSDLELLATDRDDADPRGGDGHNPSRWRPVDRSRERDHRREVNLDCAAYVRHARAKRSDLHQVGVARVPQCGERLVGVAAVEANANTRTLRHLNALDTG